MKTVGEWTERSMNTDHPELVVNGAKLLLSFIVMVKIVNIHVAILDAAYLSPEET
jgi:hypothetical protein